MAEKSSHPFCDGIFWRAVIMVMVMHTCFGAHVQPVCSQSSNLARAGGGSSENLKPTIRNQ